MKYSFPFLIIFFVFFACSEPPQEISGTETYELVSQVVEIKDTIFKVDANGQETAEIERINENSFPIRDNIKETWYFENQTLKIATQLPNSKIQEVIYQVENTEGGFFLKRKNENQLVKIIKKTNHDIILETRGKIVLKRINN